MSSGGYADAERELQQLNLCRHCEENFIFAAEKPRPLPVVVITGFLGSGKTTLVRRLLDRRANLRVAAAINDLATIPVDAALCAPLNEKALRSADAASSMGMKWAGAKGVGDGCIAVLQGCACCTSFDAGMKNVVKSALVDGVDRGELDYLLLETSGSTDPRRLIRLLEQCFGPCTRARLDRVVTVCDAERLSDPDFLLDESQGSEAKLFSAQLMHADLVLMNKIDLVSPDALKLAEANIRALSPADIHIIPCSFASVALPDILEVTEAGKAGAVMSHEQSQTVWTVNGGMDPRRTPSGTPAPEAHDAHGTRFVVVEWANDKSPVLLGSFQAWLWSELPRWGAALRRGKGVLWMAEDPSVRWEWHCSGRLRYSSERDVKGFGGAAPNSSLVLIFKAGFDDVAAVKASFDALGVTLPDAPPEVHSTLATQLRSSDPGFEILDAPSEYGGKLLLRFRLTGGARFGYADDLVEKSPLCVDVAGMNRELARLVSTFPGGSYLAMGSGLSSGQPVDCIIFPCDASSCVPFHQILAEVLLPEAGRLLDRFWAHVQSCMCGQ